MTNQTFEELPFVPEFANPLDITIIILGMVSLPLNALLLYMVRQHIKYSPGVKKKLSFGFKLIILMAITDIVTSTSNLSSYVVRLALGGGDVVQKRSTYCAVFGFLDTFLSGQTGLTTSLLAVERFFIVVKGTPFRPRVGWSLLIAANMVLGGIFLMNSLNGDFVPDPTRTYCLPYGTSISMLAEYTTGLLFYLPLFVLSFCYTSIAITCFLRRNDVAHRGFPLSRVAARALLLNMIYCACYAPTVILYSQYLISGIYPIGLFIGGPITINLTLVLNPILVIVLHQQFSDHALNLMNKPKVPHHLRLDLSSDELV